MGRRDNYRDIRLDLTRWGGRRDGGQWQNDEKNLAEAVLGGVGPWWGVALTYMKHFWMRDEISMSYSCIVDSC
jgi:hypothetical protein